MSLDDLLSNRTNFKLHACEKHLNGLKKIKNQYTWLTSTPTERIQTEIEIDEFFYQLLGAKESLLQEINTKLSLGINPRDVDLDEINIKLKTISRADIVKELNPISNEQHWLWLVNEFHNQSKHRNVINKFITRTIGTTSEDSESLINPKTKQNIGKDIVDYLDESFNNMKKLVAETRSKMT